MRDKIQAALEQLDSYVQYGNVRNRSDALPQLNYGVLPQNCQGEPGTH